LKLYLADMMSSLQGIVGGRFEGTTHGRSYPGGEGKAPGWKILKGGNTGDREARGMAGEEKANQTRIPKDFQPQVCSARGSKGRLNALLVPRHNLQKRTQKIPAA